MKCSNCRNVFAIILYFTISSLVLFDQQHFAWEMMVNDTKHRACSSISDSTTQKTCENDLQYVIKEALSQEPRLENTVEIEQVKEGDIAAAKDVGLFTETLFKATPHEKLTNVSIQFFGIGISYRTAQPFDDRDLALIRSRAMGMYGIQRKSRTVATYHMFTHTSNYLVQTIFEGESCDNSTYDLFPDCYIYRSKHFVGGGIPGKVFFFLVLNLLLLALRLMKLYHGLMIAQVTLAGVRFAETRKKVLRVAFEDLFFCNPVVKQLSIAITVGSTLTVIKNYEDAIMTAGMNKLVQLLCIIEWCEGVTAILDLLLRKAHIRMSCAGNTFAHLICIVFVFFRISTYVTAWSDNGESDPITGTYFWSTMNHTAALIGLAGSIIIVQMVVSFCISLIVEWEIWGSFYVALKHLTAQKARQVHQVSDMYRHFSSQRRRTLDSCSRTSFEQVTNVDIKKMYGYSPVTDDEMIIQGIKYIPTEWILASGIRIYGEYLVKSTGKLGA